MQFSDLHIHSKFSDGMLSPEQIVESAYKKGIKIVSITDHDTIDSQYIVEKVPSYNVHIIPGIEISSEYEGKEIHILGYFIDIHSKELKQMLEKVRLSRMDRAKAIILKLNNLDIDISFDELCNGCASIGRPHIAKVLVDKGLVSTPKEAFQKYLVRGKPGFVDRYKIPYKDVLKLINKCNGISSLAHPGEIYKGISIDNIIKDFKVYGLNAIEVFHPSHTSKEISDFYNISKKYSIGITGGSDCHGILCGSDFLIGSSGLDENLTNKFLKLKSKR